MMSWFEAEHQAKLLPVLDLASLANNLEANPADGQRQGMSWKGNTPGDAVTEHAERGDQDRCRHSSSTGEASGDGSI